MLMLITIVALTKTVTRVKQCWQVALFSLQPFNWNGSRERVQKNSMKNHKQANKTKQNKENLLTLILTLIVSDNSHAYDACFISLIILYLVLLLVST